MRGGLKSNALLLGSEPATMDLKLFTSMLCGPTIFLTLPMPLLDLPLPFTDL